LVEDEQGVRSLVCNTLAAQGYKVLEAHSSLEAASIMGSYGEPIHLLLTDVVMPQMSGRVLANHMAAIHPETRVLYMSGYTDDAIIRHGILEPNSFLLQKPFSPNGMLQKVREVLDAGRRGGP
jgi:DNA-binding NtrC family response regulator